MSLVRITQSICPRSVHQMPSVQEWSTLLTGEWIYVDTCTQARKCLACVHVSTDTQTHTHKLTYHQTYRLHIHSRSMCVFQVPLYVKSHTTMDNYRHPTRGHGSVPYRCPSTRTGNYPRYCEPFMLSCC